MLTDPVKDLGKSELVPGQRAVDESVCVQALDLDVKAIASQKDIGSRESDALIPLEEAGVITERLHQRGRFFFDGAVIAGLRTKNGGLNSALIADTMETAEHFDQSMLHPVDFSYRKVIRHLFGETLQQVTVASNRLLEGVHHLGADQMLGRNHVVQIEPERLFENMPLRLPILLGNRNELIVKLGVDLRSKLLGYRSWHDHHIPVRLQSYLFTMISQDKSLFIHVIVNKLLNRYKRRTVGYDLECNSAPRGHAGHEKTRRATRSRMYSAPLHEMAPSYSRPRVIGSLRYCL